MDSLNKNEFENNTLVSVYKEFAFYLKETAKRHDEEIDDCYDKITEIEKSVIKIESQIENLKTKEKTGWSVIEKTVAVIAFLLMFAVSVFNVLK